MPISIDIYNNEVINAVKAIQPTSALDIGPGAGKNHRLIRSAMPLLDIDCVEPVLKYIVDYNLLETYKNVYNLDISKFISQNPKQYDLIIASDIIEHLMLGDAIGVIDALLFRCQFLILIWPTNLPQHLGWEDSFETHRSNIQLADIARFNINTYKKTYMFNIGSIPVWGHYALISGHITSPNSSPRRLNISNGLAIGVINDNI